MRSIREKTSTNKPAVMDILLHGIINYLKMESTGALMVSGDWGCGKTYHIEKVVIPALEQDGYNPVKVSLFGIESVNEIPLRIADNYKKPSMPVEETEKNDEKKSWKLWGKEKAGKAVAKGTQLVSSITWLDNFVDIKALVGNHSGLLYKLIPTVNTVIFLDDIERVIDTIDIHKLLGAISGLVEQRGYKVVVFANNSYIEQKGENKLVFKEKVIEKTVVYAPDVVAIFKEICDKNYTSPFSGFMKGDIAVSVINPSFPPYKEDYGLLASLRNIRILKFALSHFNKIYEVCDAFLKEEDKEVSQTFLLALWAVTVGIAIEYKNNRLSFKDRDQFSSYVDISEIDWQFDEGSNEKDAEDLFADEEGIDKDAKENEKKRQQYASSRVSYLFRTVVKAHDLPVIVCPQIYDFVTAGVNVDKVGLHNKWEEYKAIVNRNSISPAYQLLQQFMRGQWDMSNEEMVAALYNLAQFVEDGEFSDNMSYVNSATYLQHLHELTTFTQEDLQEKIKRGIDKMYNRVKSINYFDKMNLDIIESDIPKESRWVVEYERKKMSEISSANMDADIKEVCSQFNEDLPALANRLTIKYNSTAVPEFSNYPILSHIAPTDINKKVNEIEPKEVMALYYIINTRFQQMVTPKVYDEELPFLKRLIQALEQRKEQRKGKKEYSDILIEDYLMKLMKRIQIP